ncbi:MAG: hypothetical protein EZS28_017205 [Streblomastix strix]|uniref:Uncharacterized protein n=1 Tax=Streblomastix strix TaxID=222440 RepID=A0A5J4VX24_9EUKA|nr:MAG: hypothetical protein EZS28_017205 [Streblomastix strix]
MDQQQPTQYVTHIVSIQSINNRHQTIVYSNQSNSNVIRLQNLIIIPYTSDNPINSAEQLRRSSIQLSTIPSHRYEIPYLRKIKTIPKRKATTWGLGDSKRRNSSQMDIIRLFRISREEQKNSRSNRSFEMRIMVEKSHNEKKANQNDRINGRKYGKMVQSCVCDTKERSRGYSYTERAAVTVTLEDQNRYRKCISSFNSEKNLKNYLSVKVKVKDKTYRYIGMSFGIKHALFVFYKTI